MVIVFKRLPMLAMMFSLAGCLQTPMTQTEETEKRIAISLCKVWKPITYSSRDTEQTQLEVRANNAGQKAYCQ